MCVSLNKVHDGHTGAINLESIYILHDSDKRGDFRNQGRSLQWCGGLEGVVMGLGGGGRG